MNSDILTQAVILAGGRGTRLRPITDTVPKPMVPVNGRPFLEYLIELLRGNGIHDIVLLLGYLPEKITGHFGDGSRLGVRIRYSITDVEDETGTRLKKAEKLLNERFLLVYCDNYWPMQLDKMFAFYRSKNVLGTLTAYNNRDAGGEYGPQNNVRVEESGDVAYYGPFTDDPKANAVDIGFFILHKDVVRSMPEENISFQSVILPQLIARKQLAAYRTDRPYYFVTSPATLSVTEKFLEQKKVVFLDRDGVINRQMPPHEYVLRWNQFEFLPGAEEAIRLLTEAGYDIYIISNQRAISRGLMTENDLANIHRKMTDKLTSSGGRISGIYYCPHSKDDGCFCRKPKPGMFLRAAREHHVDVTKAILVGNDKNDLLAGEAAGCRTMLVGEDGLLPIVQKLIQAS